MKKYLLAVLLCAGLFCENAFGQTPPSITLNLPANQTVYYGNNTTFQVAATGSTPLNYAWYLNGGTLSTPFAQSNILNATNYLWFSEGHYLITATVSNAFGGTNFQTCDVEVLPETNVPTLTITSPTNGEQVSNSEFTITGTYSDPVDVFNVTCFLNGRNDGGVNFGSSNTWSATVDLTPGSNTLSAYDVNQGNIPSKLTSVLFEYVDNFPLTVITNHGSVSPDYNGQELREGNSYSMTATPDQNFRFTDWTGSVMGEPFVSNKNTTVTFTMQPDLVMTANFDDIFNPFLKITNPPVPLLITNIPAYTVMGVATDDEQMAFVTYSLNGSPTNAVNTGNGWTNWYESISLAGGTNIFTAYATATNGNMATDTVDIVYIVTNQLTVITNHGSASPDYNGQYLRIGENYSMTATPASGFIFTNWTGGIGSATAIYTNSPTVTFMMETNLVMQANFLDTLKPYLEITNPISSLAFVTNLTAYTFMGVATDDEAVASVKYSFDGSPYTNNAATTGIQWSATNALTAGTNIFSAYVVATNGNLSATDTVDVVLISPNPLTVVTNGRGSITPVNYTNHVPLDVSFNYSMTVTPATGFIFTNWVGTIGGTQVLTTNKPTVAFTMETNLMLAANLIDTIKPYIQITNPIPAIWVVTNQPTYTVSGAATDDEDIAYVYYSFNGGPYTSASIDEPPAAIQSAAIPAADLPDVQWSSALLALKAGTNTFSVYALATNGNYSVTDTVDIILISPNPLTVVTNGRGTISPSNYTNGVPLDPGFYYNMTVTPATGFIFTNWVGTIGGTQVLTTNKPTVTFLMQTNLTMAADLVDTLKPYLQITNPLSSPVQITNLNFTVMGVATDDEAIASVNFSLNGSPYTNSATINGIQWSATLALAEGTNTFAVYALATNGNTSATNQITFIRYPNITTFLIETNNPSIGNVYSPQAQMSFDGANYLVVFQGDPTNTPAAAMGVTVSSNGVVGSPVQLISNLASNSPPYLDYDGTNYLVAWDHDNGLIGGRFRPSDLEEIEDFIGNSTTVKNFSTVAYGDGFYLVLWSDSGGLTSNSIYADEFTAAESVVYGDTLLSSNGLETEAGGISAAFGDTNFLVVWGSATGNAAITGQFFGTNGSPVGASFVIYSNSTPAGLAIPHVTFDGGTNFLVLFNTGVNPATSASSYKILGRFVTTTGVVLTNQMTLTTDSGPQLGACADFDGVNYLVTWVQGLNPYAVDTATTTYGRYFDSQGNPTTAEFPIWTTQPNAEIPLWAPVMWNGSQFALVGGMGHMLTAVPSVTTSLTSFTNNVINGAFISP